MASRFFSRFVSVSACGSWRASGALAACLLAAAPQSQASGEPAPAPQVAAPSKSAHPEQQPAVSDSSAVYSQLSILARALQLVRQDYVDEGKVSYQSLIRAALRGVLSNLDPHSQFLDPKEYKSVQDDTSSRFNGVGLVVTQRDGRLVVVTPMEASPGLRAGIQAGDHLLKIDDQLTEKIGASEAANLLRGDVGRPVKLVVYTPSTQETREVELVREAIHVGTVRDAKLLTGASPNAAKIGYVRVTQFNSPTAGELATALENLEKQGIQGLVLDLRHNPGGLLDSAVEVAGLFLPPNSLVVSTEGRVESQNRGYRTSSDSKPRFVGPLAVLINHGSASASEILAGALKDLRRAILVGETSFGKGSVQSVIPLPDGSALRLTTAKYYTPGKQVIHEHGIEPTIYAALTPEQERLFGLQRREDSLDAKERRELAAFRDPQLDRAADTLRAILLYSQKAEPKSGAGVPK